MKILKREQIDEITSALIEGKVLILPSESSYGLSCDATNQLAVEKIFKIKGRESGKAVLVLVDSVKMAKKYLGWDKLTQAVAEKYWSEKNIQPLTVVGDYQKKFLVKKLAKSTISGQGNLAVRVTMHPLLQQLCRRLGRPIVSTSANISGSIPLYSAAEIIKQFSGRGYEPDLIVDDGRLPSRRPSTIVSVTGDKYKILRQGDVIVS